MTPNEWLRELAYPLTNGVMVLALIVFYLLLKLSFAAGLIGLWLLIVILPAVFRFLMRVADARIAGREPEPPGAELFNWIAGVWVFMPPILLYAAWWAVTTSAQNLGVLAAGGAGLVASVLIPASIGVLGLTHSPLSSIDPRALQNLLRLCGREFLIIPATLLPLAVGLYLVHLARVPSLIVHWAALYFLFLLYSLTAAIVSRSEAPQHVDIEEPVLPDEAAMRVRAEGERTKTLDHAYGLVSRGNRDGGFAHVDAYLQRSAVMLEDYRWFFEAMLRWEEPEHALFFGQRYLATLLDCNEQLAALKLLARCQLENPRFKPLAEDRPRVLELAQRHDREDLARLLS